MPDYGKGKIYKIVCNTSGKCYVGSTVKARLCDRLSGHVYEHKMNNSKNTKSFEIIEGGNYDIVLIENFPCSTKEELHARERHWIESLECVNRYIPTRTTKEYQDANKDDIKAKKQKYRAENKDKIKEWYHANKNQLKEKRHAYNEANPDKVNEYRKEYREANKDKIREYNKEYNKVNNDKRNEWRRKVVACECGILVSKRNMKAHKNSLTHQEQLNKKTDILNSSVQSPQEVDPALPSAI